jgi:hypothetical protein
VRKTDNLAAICEPIVYNMWEPRLLTTLWASTGLLQGELYLFYIISAEVVVIAEQNVRSGTGCN